MLNYTWIDFLPPATCAALFLARSIEMSRRRSEVKGSIVAPYTLAGLIGSGTLVVACALTEYFLEHRRFSAGMYAAGVAIGISSFLLRASAAKALGRFWSMQIEIREDHPLVTEGPYGWVRHPIYTAAILEMIAALVLCQAEWSIIPAALIFAPILAIRIRLEEVAMTKHFGTRYTTYIKTVPPIVAFRRSKGGVTP